MPTSGEEPMQNVHDDFEDNLPPEVAKMRAETEALIAQLEKAARMSPPMEWWYQRSKRYEEMYVNHPDLIPRAGYLMALRVLVWVVAVCLFTFGVGRDITWLVVPAGAAVGAFACLSILAPMTRAKAYRNGYMERGRHDWSVVVNRCSDAQDREAIQREQFALDVNAMRYL